jgi:hypothetical protein
VKLLELQVKVFKHVLKAEAFLECFHDVPRTKSVPILTHYECFYCLSPLDAWIEDDGIARVVNGGVNWYLEVEPSQRFALFLIFLVFFEGFLDQGLLVGAQVSARIMEDDSEAVLQLSEFLA